MITTKSLWSSLEPQVAVKQAKEIRAMVKKNKGSYKNTILVEFKASKELVESFDLRSKPNFSSRSEALRTLMRSFIEKTSERSRNPVERS